jgi:hypothetical protein
MNDESLVKQESSVETSPLTEAKEVPAKVKKVRAGVTVSTKKHLTPTKKAELFTLWRTGEYTLRELAIRFDRAPEVISRLLTKEGVKKGEHAAEIAQRTAEATRKKISDEIATHMESIKVAKSDSNKVYETLRKLLITTILEARRAGLPIASVLGEMKVIDMASRAARTLQAGQFEVLGIVKEEKNKEDEPSELRIVNLTGDQIREMGHGGDNESSVQAEIDKLNNSLGDESLIESISDDSGDDDDDDE